MLRSIFRKPAGRILTVILLPMLALPLGSWVVLRGSMILKAREAKTLLDKVKALRVRDSTFQDAMRLASQYRGKVDYQGEACTFERCSFVIHLGTWPKQPGPLAEKLRFFGIRAYGAESAIDVLHGRVVETDYLVSAEVRLGASEHQWIVAGAKVSDSFPRVDYYEGRQSGLDAHPNYRVFHPILSTEGGGQIIWGEVTADANVAERERGFDIRLSCISSLKGCSELSEFAPSAWEDLMALSKEEGKPAQIGKAYGPCPARSLARIARDMENVLQVEVQRVFPVKDGEDGLQDVEFRLVEVLKGQADKHLSRFPMQVPENDAALNRKSSGLPPKMFLSGNQVLLFLANSDLGFTPYPYCEVASASPENLAVVRQTLMQLAQGLPITALADGQR